MEPLASLVQMGQRQRFSTQVAFVIPVGQRLPEAQRGLKEARQGSRVLEHQSLATSPGFRVVPFRFLFATGYQCMFCLQTGQV